MKDDKCQIMSLDSISRMPSRFEIALQRIRKLRCTFGRRKDYLQNWIDELRGRKESQRHGSKVALQAQTFKAGDLVYVKSEKDIRKTLDRWNHLKGCGFMDEMWKYCGTKQKVFKPVKQFLDERDYLKKKCSGIVILEGLICEGTRGFGKCDRACYFFWREEWLEKIDQ